MIDHATEESKGWLQPHVLFLSFFSPVTTNLICKQSACHVCYTLKRNTTFQLLYSGMNIKHLIFSFSLPVILVLWFRFYHFSCLTVGDFFLHFCLAFYILYCTVVLYYVLLTSMWFSFIIISLMMYTCVEADANPSALSWKHFGSTVTWLDLT